MLRLPLPRSESFSNVDAAWLHMDSPTNLAVITGIFMFDEPLDYKRVVHVIQTRFLTYRRFLQRVREPAASLGLPRWEDDRTFDIRSHIHRVALPAPGDQKALEELAGDLMSIPLDPTKPLWSMHLVDNYGAGSALMIRLHHAVADGIALMQVLLSMTDTERYGYLQPRPNHNHHHRGLVERLVHNTTAPIRATYHMAETLVQEGKETLQHPARLIDAASLATASTRALGKLLFIGPDQSTVFKGRCGVPKRAAWSTPLKLDEVKAVGRAMNCTVNDVLLTAVTGALRDYQLRRKGAVDGPDIRAMVPVNLRPPEEEGLMGNRFGLVFLSLPIGIRDPVRRLKILKQRMDEIKNTPEAVVAFGILGVIGLTPVQIENIITSIFGMKATAVMTNVPGPRDTVYFAGAPIKRIMFWVPHPANLGMGVSIFSYAGEIVVGIASDAGLVPDPEAVVEGFCREYHRIKGLVPAFCQGMTKSGKHCKNLAMEGSTFCYTHQNKNGHDETP